MLASILIVFRIDYIIRRRIIGIIRDFLWIINWHSFTLSLSIVSLDSLSQSIAKISMVDDSAKSSMVKRARDERWRKRRWLPGGRWRTLLLLASFPRCPSPSCSFPYRGPLPIFPRTQHVVPAFIIIVIIISVDGPLMNRCEDSWAGRDSKGMAKETGEEDTILRQKEREEERTARSGRKRWTERRG